MEEEIELCEAFIDDLRMILSNDDYKDCKRLKYYLDGILSTKIELETEIQEEQEILLEQSKQEKKAQLDEFWDTRL